MNATYSPSNSERDWESWKSQGWRFVVRCYYRDDASPPKPPGGLAIETRHKSQFLKDIEVSAAREREDIGKIEEFEL